MPVCVYWDESAMSKYIIYCFMCIFQHITPDGRGDWSSEGCERVGRKYRDRVICECDHLSTFGVFVVRTYSYTYTPWILRSLYINLYSPSRTLYQKSVNQVSRVTPVSPSAFVNKHTQ